MILTTGGIDDLCLKQFVEAGAMAVRRCKKADLKRIAKATGGKPSTLMNFTDHPNPFSDIVNRFGEYGR